MFDFGKYDVYSVYGSKYCYTGTNVLRNRFNIRDAGLLRKLDADISSIKQIHLIKEPVKGRFTANHLCQIHKFLFEDIYPFAGHFRREDIMKGQTRFQEFSQISGKLSILLSELKKENYLRGLDFELLIERSAHYFAELNYIHPFREGNGRAIREFMRQLYDYNGYEVNWSTVSGKELLGAMEESVYATDSLQRLLSCILTKK